MNTRNSYNFRTKLNKIHIYMNFFHYFWFAIRETEISLTSYT